MNIKKITSLLFVLFLVFAMCMFASCSNDTQDENGNSNNGSEEGLPGDNDGESGSSEDNINKEENENISTTPNLDLTYEEYYNMSEAAQLAHYNSFSSPADFFTWFNDAKAEYEEEQDRVEIGGDGSIDVGGKK